MPHVNNIVDRLIKLIIQTLVPITLMSIEACAQNVVTNSDWITIINDKCIYDNNKHAAFTSMVEDNGTTLVAFREGEAHDPTATNNGVITILKESNGKWQPQQTFSKKGFDLRDPGFLKLNNSLFLYTNAFFSELNNDGWTELKPINHNAPYAPLLPSIWKKRVYKDVAYGIGFKRNEWPILFKSEDGVNWEVVCQYKLGGNASEADMVFIGNTMYICIRVDTPDGSNSFWGKSVYPFTECEWSVMDISIASPEMIVHSNKTILLACREYHYNQETKINSRNVSIFALDKNGKVKGHRVLVDDAGPQGDQGYASIKKSEKGIYNMSYYAGERTHTKVCLLSFIVNDRKINKTKK